MNNPDFSPNSPLAGHSPLPAHLLDLQQTLRRAFRLLITSADTETVLLELPVGQVRCLRRIMENEGCKLVDLARETNLSLPNASRLVDRLVQRKLVVRDTDPSDRRAVRLHATDEAKALIESINLQRLQHIRLATHSVSPDQVQQIIKDLQILISAAEAAQEHTASADSRTAESAV